MIAFIAKEAALTFVPWGMSKNAKDLDACMQHSEVTDNSKSANNKMQRLIRAKGKLPHVAVIGAGVAGLRCADVLTQAGIKVSIYEARDRVGGRVHQVDSAGHLVDVGANWLHGNVKSNPITRLAAKTETVLYEWEDRQAVIDSAGHRMDDANATAYSETVWEIVAQAFKYSDEYSSSIDPQRSLMDYFKQEVAKRESDPAKVAEMLKMAQRWGAFVGDPIERQSLKFFYLEETIEGENAFVAGTYRKILHEIAANALAKAEVHFNTEIQRIETCRPLDPAQHDELLSRGRTLDDLVDPKVSIRTSSTPSVQHEFDEVVVTVPLGWLKANKKTAFTTPLPQRLSEAMENISYGRLEKCYITFPIAFWNGESAGGTETQPNLSNNTTNTATRKPQTSSGPASTSTIATSTTTSTTTTEPYPRFTHFQSPNYVPHPPSQSWNQECISLATLPTPTAHPTLLFYVFGPCATAMVISLTSLPPHSPAYNAALTAFFAPFYSKLPFYSAHAAECTPLAFLATQWQADPFAGHGSYTNYQVGLREGDKDIEAMRHGWPERGLWFAGEHTAPFVALGTTTGAYWAGEGVARRICAAYGVEVPAEAGEEGEGVEGKVEVASTVAERREKERERERSDAAANVNGLAL